MKTREGTIQGSKVWPVSLILFTTLNEHFLQYRHCNKFNMTCWETSYNEVWGPYVKERAP